VTSPTQGDGKTVTAANLAAALALSGERVIAVDADLRHAGLSEAFGLDRSVGLTSLVLGTADLDEVLQQRSPNLSVLATGPLPPNPSEILGSQIVHRVLAEMVARADVVVIDAPPTLPVADALALANQVDGVLLVVRHGHTLRHAAAETSRRLDAIGANLLGYVLNAVPRGESRGVYADDRYAAANERPPAGRRRATGYGSPGRGAEPAPTSNGRPPAGADNASRPSTETVVPDAATSRLARRHER
jgi:non-specific protein-tyrosine kinase